MRRTTARMRVACGPAVLLALLGAPAPAQGEAFEITPELLARIVGEALPLVRESQGVALAGVEVRLGTRAELESALEAENRELLGRTTQDPELGARQARELARGLAPALFAKYVFASDDVLVQADAFGRLARITGIRELEGEPALRAVVLHELVHAADDERHDLSVLLGRCSTVDAVRAANAVIEGHAQLVARELAPRLGCAEGFATYTRAITAPPKGLVENGDEGTQMALRSSAGFLTTSYTEGEAFFAALRAQGGEAAVQRAFREPPADAVLIARPEWFLHPELRPRAAFELDPALDAFVADFEGEGWTRQRTSVSAADMRNSLTPLEVAEIDALSATLRQNRVQTLANPRTGAQLVLGLFEFGTPAEAAAYPAAYERMQHARDETMKTGAIHIVSSDYETLAAPDPAGVCIEKRIASGVTFDVTLLCVARGPLALEMMAANLPAWDGDRLLEAAVAALDEVESHPREKK